MSVNLSDYTTVQGLARMVKIPPPRMHRIIKHLGLPCHRIGSHILIRKAYAERVQRALESKELRSGPKKGEKKKALAWRAGPKHRLVTTQ